LQVGTDFRMAICPGGTIEGGNAGMSGVFYAQVFIRRVPAAQPVVPFSRADRVPYGWAMRGRYSVYSRFSNPAELALSCAAWLEAMVLTIRSLNEKGLRVQRSSP
jgi:hypothetical protein